jgi:hypothetical protein
MRHFEKVTAGGGTTSRTTAAGKPSPNLQRFNNFLCKFSHSIIGATEREFSSKLGSQTFPDVEFPQIASLLRFASRPN